MRRLFDRFAAWGDIPVWQHPPIIVRRIDVLLVFFGVICVGYYGWMEGLLGALRGALAYAFVVMVALWLL